MWRRKIPSWSSLDRNGTIIATRCLALQYCGFPTPPNVMGNDLSKTFSWYTTVVLFLLSLMGPSVRKSACDIYRADFRLAPSQWETALQSNAVSHWLDANLESTLFPCLPSSHIVERHYRDNTVCVNQWECQYTNYNLFTRERWYSCG